MIYKNIHSSLILVGFFSILDNETEVCYKNFEQNSDTIVRLCSECHLARSRLSNGGMLARRLSQNAMFALRRELRAVFCISLQLRRSGRFKVKSYKLCLPVDLLALAEESTFFEEKTLPTVSRLSNPPVDLCFPATNVDSKLVCSPVKTTPKIPIMNVNNNQIIINDVAYSIVDYGGQGNCLFLSVAGSLQTVFPSSSLDHYSLRYLTSEWYKTYGLQHQARLGAKPCEVILDNPDTPPQDIFKT